MISLLQTKAIERSTIWNLNTFNFFLFGSIGSLMTFFPAYFDSIGINPFFIGLIMAGGPFISIIANPFWGFLSDRLQNIKRIIIILSVASLIIIQFVFISDALPVVITVMLIFFFFNNSIIPQSNSLIFNTIEGTAYKYGSFRLWGSLGWSVMVMAAGPILNKIGIEQLDIVYSVMLLIALLATIRLPIGHVEGVKKAEKGAYKKDILGNKVFIIFILLGVLISVPNSINQTFSTLYILELNGTPVHIGWNAFIMAIFEIPIFLLLDRYLKQDTKVMLRMLMIVSFLFVIRWILMAVAVTPTQIVLIQALHCVTFGGYFYIGTTLTAKMIPVELRASGQALFAITWGGLSGLIAGASGGLLFEKIGPSNMYIVTTFLALAGAIGFIFLYRYAKQTLTEA